MTYDFTSLSHADFEDLSRDLIGKELGVRFEAFTAGGMVEWMVGTRRQNRRRSSKQSTIAAFIEVMRDNVINGEVAFRRAYLRSVIDRVEVDESEVRIIGRNTVLEGLVMGGGAAAAPVPGFVWKWRARNDSNVRPSDS